MLACSVDQMDYPLCSQPVHRHVDEVRAGHANHGPRKKFLHQPVYKITLQGRHIFLIIFSHIGKYTGDLPLSIGGNRSSRPGVEPKVLAIVQRTEGSGATQQYNRLVIALDSRHVLIVSQKL